MIVGLDINFHFNVSDNYTVYFEMDKLTISFDGYYNNTVKVSLFTIKQEIKIV